jgi:hypothetical protein
MLTTHRVTNRLLRIEPEELKQRLESGVARDHPGRPRNERVGGLRPKDARGDAPHCRRFEY